MNHFFIKGFFFIEREREIKLERECVKSFNKTFSQVFRHSVAHIMIHITSFPLISLWLFWFFHTSRVWFPPQKFSVLTPTPCAVSTCPHPFSLGYFTTATRLVRSLISTELLRACELLYEVSRMINIHCFYLRYHRIGCLWPKLTSCLSLCVCVCVCVWVCKSLQCSAAQMMQTDWITFIISQTVSLFSLISHLKALLFSFTT